MIQYQNEAMTVFQSALYHTTSTVIETGDMVLVVDPTWLPHEVDEIRHYVVEIRKGRPLYLLFTHSDWDHIIGYGAFPDAMTIGSEAFLNNPDWESSLDQIRNFDARYYIRRTYEPVYPKLDVVIQRDGQQLVVGGTTLTFYLAPGHTECGIFTVVEPCGIWLAGDYLSDLEFPYVYDSVRAYEGTLDKVNFLQHKHPFRVMVPGHGNVAKTREEMEERRQASQQYLQELRTFVRDGNQKALDQMLLAYPFPRGMKSFHQDNQARMRSELGIDSPELT